MLQILLCIKFAEASLGAEAKDGEVDTRRLLPLSMGLLGGETVVRNAFISLFEQEL